MELREASFHAPQRKSRYSRNWLLGCILPLVPLLAPTLLGVLASTKEGASADRQGAGQNEIRLGMSLISRRVRGRSASKLYRGGMAYLLPVNNVGGVNGRRVVITAYDDQCEPDLAIRNTLKLMDEDDVFALFGYVGTIADCRNRRIQFRDPTVVGEA
jgi:hypothetical protein